MGINVPDPRSSIKSSRETRSAPTLLCIYSSGLRRRGNQLVIYDPLTPRRDAGWRCRRCSKDRDGKRNVNVAALHAFCKKEKKRNVGRGRVWRGRLGKNILL